MGSGRWFGDLGLILMFIGSWMRIRVLTRENEATERHLGNIWIRLQALERQAAERANLTAMEDEH